jgi:hypothetical protein
MDRTFLEGLGLNVREADGVLEAELEMRSGEAMNPLTRTVIETVTFTVLGDRLIAIDPAELVGTPPILIPHLTGAAAIEDLVVKSVNDSLMHAQRRSKELSMLGINPKTDPRTLLCSAELQVGDYKFCIGNDRQGNFRVVWATHQGADLTTSGIQSFELSEFRERAALEAYLGALYGETAPHSGLRPQAERPVDVTPTMVVDAPDDVSIPTGELVAAFGTNASVPPRCQLEIVINLRVGGERYRFVAARVAGKTFRGMLAGASGKVWAERFDLETFPGVRALISEVLKVAPDTIEVAA